MHISPDCCISQSVRPHILASVCLEEYHRNNKEIQECQSTHKSVGFFQFDWYSLLHLEYCVVRGFRFLSNAEMGKKRSCTGGKKGQHSGVLVGAVGGGIVHVPVSRRHITHFDIS